MKDTIIKYWFQLEKRERWILGLGTLIVGLILFYALILKPWHRAISEMSERIPKQRSNLVWMKQTSDMILSGKVISSVEATKDANKSLLSVIEQTARTTNVNKYIQQMVPGTNIRTNIEQVNVVLEEADFNLWVRWVDDLSNNYGVDISQLSVESETDEPNIVELRVTFERG